MRILALLGLVALLVSYFNGSLRAVSDHWLIVGTLVFVLLAVFERD